MARWIQKYDKATNTSTFIPVDEQAQKRDLAEGKTTLIIRDNFESFRSIVDGSLISNHRDLENHNKRNNVVNSAEFNPEFLERKQKERKDRELGVRTKEETLRVKKEIYERVIRSEQGLSLQ
jgi:hypothetical protein